MAVVKADIYQGTTQTESRTLLRHNRAIRLFRVSELAEAQPSGEPGGPAGPQSTPGRLQEAIDEVKDKIGDNPNHPTINDLPLQRLRARLIGPTTAMVEAIYGVDILSDSGGGGNGQAPVIMRFQTAFEPVPVFTETHDANLEPQFSVTGLPSTLNDLFNSSPLLRQTEERRPDHWIWQRPILRIMMPVNLTYNPLIDGNLVSKTGKVNSDTFTFNSITFLPHQMRFDGADVDVLSIGSPFGGSGSPTIYRIDYTFSATPGRFYRHFPRWDINANPARWVVREFPQYQTTPFIGQFPLI